MVVHRALMIVGFEQVAITVHRDLQAAVTGEGLHGLGAEPRLDISPDDVVQVRLRMDAMG